MRNIISKILNSKSEIAPSLPESKQEVQVLKGIEKEYPLIVQEVHGLFNNAADKLLNEAREIVSACNQKMTFLDNKAERLEKLGFVNTEEYREYLAEKDDVKYKLSIIRAIESYKQKYPLYKYITIKQVNEICQKYGLIWGDLSLYKGFVPNKNLKEIENFKIQDVHWAYCKVSYLSGRPISEEFFSQPRYSDPIEELNYHYHPYGNAIREIMDKFKDIILFRQNIYKKYPFQIAAPIKDMNISDRHKIEGYRIIEIVDPIVFAPTLYTDPQTGIEIAGALIATMWGDEASDPILTNEKLN